MEEFRQGVFVLAGTRAVQAPRHPAAPAHKVNHIRETVSYDWAEMSKYRVVCGLVKKGGRRGAEEMMRGGRGRGVHPSSLPTCTVCPPLLGWASEPDRLRSEPAEPEGGHWPGAGPPLGSPWRASLSSRARFSWIRVLISSWNLHICSWSSLMRFTTHCERRSSGGEGENGGQQIRWIDEEGKEVGQKSTASYDGGKKRT